MKRIRAISDLAGADKLILCLLRRHTAGDPRALAPVAQPPLGKATNLWFARQYASSSSSSSPVWCPEVLRLFPESPSHQAPGSEEDLSREVSELSDELAWNAGDYGKVVRLLEEKGNSLLRRCLDGRPIVELLKKLDSLPRLALMVLNWRRRNVNVPMTEEEYANGIEFAGRVNDVDLASELYAEASDKGIKSASIFDAMIRAYLSNGYAEKCQSFLVYLKKEGKYRPSIVTYNTLIMLFGCSMLYNHMESVFREIKESNLSPDITTYNNLITGYLSAWMWDKIENTYQLMKIGPVKPDTTTHLLMLRGYMNSGNLEKMGEIYEVIKDYVNQNEIPLIRTMISAYCKSSGTEICRKVEFLERQIPEQDYKPWLNVLLIRFYARENQLEAMENAINEVFKHKTPVQNIHVLESISGAYFQSKAVDKLVKFVKRAESEGWRICRSFYHTKMVIFASENRLEEMEGVLREMNCVNLGPTKKTFWILYKAYLTSGQSQRRKAAMVIGLMFKLGYDVPSDVLPE